MKSRDFEKILRVLERVPGIEGGVGHGTDAEGCWWIKFSIDIDHPVAWRVIQEFGHVLNLLSLNERLPTTFHPVSPLPYMNGGPKEFLSWVIECRDREFSPDLCAEWLESRTPDPVDDEKEWLAE